MDAGGRRRTDLSVTITEPKSCAISNRVQTPLSNPLAPDRRRSSSYNGLAERSPRIPVDIDTAPPPVSNIIHIWNRIADTTYHDDSSSDISQLSTPTSTLAPMQAVAKLRELADLHSTDSRIMTDVTKISASESLRMLRGLCPKSFVYESKKNNSRNTIHGFIAQDVQKIFPNAVMTQNVIIPNIYQSATAISDTLVFCDEIHLVDNGLPVRELVIYCPDGNVSCSITVVSQVNAKTIRFAGNIDHILRKGECFVYGQRIANLMTVDNKFITTMYCAAIQEIDAYVRHMADKVHSMDAMADIERVRYDDAAALIEVQGIQLRLIEQRLIRLEVSVQRERMSVQSRRPTL